MTDHPGFFMKSKGKTQKQKVCLRECTFRFSLLP